MLSFCHWRFADKRAAALPVQEAADVWTTAVYKWQDFGTPLQLYLPSITR